MLDEKFKIRISGFLRQVLELDAVAFNFVDSKGEGNLGGFLNKLIPVLMKRKKLRREEILEYAKNELHWPKMKEIDIEQIALGLNSIFDKVYFSDGELSDLSQILWIRPSKANLAIFDEILDSETEITGLRPSAYIRTILNEYCRLPKYIREQIVFDDECSLALQAMDSGKILKFRYHDIPQKVYVFGCIYEYLLEQGNYLLCYDVEKNMICSYQISEIRNLHLLQKVFVPNKQLKELFQQYTDMGMWLNDEIIELGEKGNEKR